MAKLKNPRFFRSEQAGGTFPGENGPSEKPKKKKPRFFQWPGAFSRRNLASAEKLGGVPAGLADRRGGFGDPESPRFPGRA